MVIANPKKEFNPYIDRRFLNVPVSTSYTSRVSKIQGYETRMFYHTNHCKNSGGQIFNTTLTYNDNALHEFYGYKVPEFDDLRWLLHDSTFRYALQDLGVDHFDYFVGTELGEGKGKRGYHNNPHYHVIWFLFPVPGKKLSISSDKFLHLVKSYWQGEFYLYKGRQLSYSQMMEEYSSSPEFQFALSHPHLYTFQRCKFGMVSTGRYGCEVKTDFGMNTYVCKYATKDVTAIDRENSIKIKAHSEFFDQVALEHPNWSFEDIEQEAQIRTTEVVRYYRRHHSTKVHCSQGLGLSAKDFIIDPMEPKVPYLTSKGVQYRTIPQYIFRKVYRKLGPDKTYLKNDLGKELEIHNKKHCEELMVKKAYDGYMFFKSLDKDKYSKVVSKVSHYDISHMDEVFSHFERDINTINKTNWYENIFNKYAVFKTYYQYLSYNSDDFDGCLSPYDDWLLSLDKRYDPLGQKGFNYDYSTLPIFTQDLWMFNILDDMCEIKNQVLDIDNKKKYDEKQRIRRAFDDVMTFASQNVSFQECEYIQK